jgi:hypothetical protein
MKRISLILTLAASLVLVAAMAAHAVEITVNGTFDFNFGWSVNPDGFSSKQDMNTRTARYAQPTWNKGGSARGTEEHFIANQRVRTQINFIASENVQGVLFFEIGELQWGNGNGSFATAAGGTRVATNGGGAIGTDGVNIKTRRAYIDFNIPNTELLFRVGLQGLAGPAAVAGSPIIGTSGTDVAAILGIYKINDMVSVAAFWARPWNTNVGTEAVHAYDEIDMFGLLVPVTMKGIGSFTPYFMFANMGTNAVATTSTSGFPGLYTNALGTNLYTAQNGLLRSKYMTAWWLGGAIEFTMLDPLTFGLDVVYGAVDHPSSQFMDRSGWYVAGKVAYKTPWVTPTLIGWWSTGDDSNIYNGSERLPSVDADFNATTFGFAGSGVGGSNTMTGFNYGMASRSDRFDSSAAGTWGLALQFNNISFIEDLTHQIIVAYIGGTNSTRSMQDRRAIAGNPGTPYYNNPSSIYLTTADSMWEVDFNTKYQMYENLAVYCEMGMFDIQRAAYPWRTPENRLNSGFYNANALKLWDTSTAWKLMFGLQYKF